MPTYVYGCCDKEWENLHTISERNTEVCLNCNGNAEIVIQPTQRPVVMNYYSESLNARITGPAQKKRLMREKSIEEV